MEEVKVAVCIVTYNHEKYIEQSVNSVIAQEAPFDIDIYVGDDASTDHTTQILRRMQKNNPQIKLYCNEHNIGTVRNTIMLYNNIFKADCYKYVAMLDGDDWWIDNSKLRKQVEFLENNPNYSFVYTRIRLYSGKKEKSSPQTKYPHGDVFEQMMNMGVPNCTILHRTQFLMNIDFDEIIQQNLLSCDYSVNVLMAQQGMVGFIDAETAVWRRTNNTVSSPQSLQSALNYIEHETKQDVFLGKKLRGTAFEKQLKNIPFMRWQKRFNLSIVRKDWSLMYKVMNESESKYILQPWFSQNRIYFYIYVYFIKKINTLRKMIFHL